MRHAALTLVLFLALLSADATAGAYYRTVTGYSGPNCVGAYTTREVRASGVCLPAASGTGSYMRIGTLTTTAFTSSVQYYSDAACATPSGAATLQFTESGLSNYGKCVTAATVGGGGGSTSYSVQYSARAPTFVDRGVVWSGFSTSAACAAQTSAVAWKNYTSPSACLPYSGGTYATLNCDGVRLQRSVFSSATCSPSSYLAPQSKNTSLSSLQCLPNNAMIEGGAGADAFLRPSCAAPMPTTPQALVPVTESGSYIVKIYHADKECSPAATTASASAYRILPLVVNSCNGPAVPTEAFPFRYSCKVGAEGVTVDKAYYPTGDATCSQPPTSARLAFHLRQCAQPQAPEAFRTEVRCSGLGGALPASLAASDQLVLQEYSDPSCSLEPVTKGVALGACIPVFGAAATTLGLPNKVAYRHKLAFSAYDAASRTYRITETRYQSEDRDCAGMAVQSSVLQFVDGKCQKDPLASTAYGAGGGFVGGVARLAGGVAAAAAAGAAPPSWFTMPPPNFPSAAPSSASPTNPAPHG